jgi:hypothetical protein
MATIRTMTWQIYRHYVPIVTVLRHKTTEIGKAKKPPAIKRGANLFKLLLLQAKFFC